MLHYHEGHCVGDINLHSLLFLQFACGLFHTFSTFDCNSFSQKIANLSENEVLAKLKCYTVDATYSIKILSSDCRHVQLMT